MSKVLVFSHIPKTAGTSMSFLLNRYFGTSKLDVIPRRNRRSTEYTANEFRKDLWLYPGCRVLAGHSLKPFIDFEEFEATMSWFTFLRDPVRRYVSHYIHQQTSRKNHHKMSMPDWAGKYRRSNWMVRMMAGEENLSKAIDCLERKIDFVGFTELLDESMKMFKNKYQLIGFDPNLPVQKMTVRNSRLEEEIYQNYDRYEELIRVENELDIKLYEYAKDFILPEQRKKYLDDIGDRKFGRIRHDRNIILAKIKRNLLYKPFIKVDSLLISQRNIE